MEKIKKLVRKNAVYLVIGGVLVVCVALMFLTSKIENPGSDTESDNMEIVDVMVNVECSEADDDTLYNYVINPSKLDGMEIPAVHIIDVADEINRALQYKEIYGQKAEITSVTKRGTKVNFIVRVMESDVEIIGEYDKSTGEVKCE